MLLKKKVLSYHKVRKHTTLTKKKIIEFEDMIFSEIEKKNELYILLIGLF